MARAERKPTKPKTLPPAEPAHYLNREASWLAFNERVLEEAADPAWPLLERLKFFAIFHANLDEFFMIRVSGLHGQLVQPDVERSPDGLSAREQLTRIAEVVRRQLRTASDLFAKQLVPELSTAGVRLRSWETLEPELQERARAYFRTTVFPVLTPLAVDPGHPFPFISNLSLSLAVEAEDPEAELRRFARVKVPEILPRFVPLDAFREPHSAEPAAASEFLPLESLISANLDALFPGMRILGVYPFRITRDMDIEIMEDEADDLLVTIDREIRRRKFGAVVRLEVDPRHPDRIRAFLLSKLEIDQDDLYETPAPLGPSALFALAGLPRPDLHDAPFIPAVPREFLEAADPFEAIRGGDILLHLPYDAFTPVLTFLRKAAEDPAVLAIKMTLYRTGSNSEIVKSLIAAAENGKQVAVAIELKARFDEQNNIEWARALERAGVHVVYGSAGLKIQPRSPWSSGERRTASAATSTSPPATTTPAPPHLHGPRPLHLRPGPGRGRDGSLQLPVWLLQGQPLPEAGSGADDAGRAGAGENRRPGRARARREARAYFRQDECPGGRPRHPGPLPRLPGWRGD